MFNLMAPHTEMFFSRKLESVSHLSSEAGSQRQCDVFFLNSSNTYFAGLDRRGPVVITTRSIREPITDIFKGNWLP